MRQAWLVALIWSFFAASAAAQQVGVLKRDAVLRSGPSRSSDSLGVVEAGSAITLLRRGHRSGYYRVRTQTEDVGWVTDRAVELVDPAEFHQPSDTTAPLATAPDQLTVDRGPFDGCDVQGTALSGSGQALNELKNRSAEPGPRDIDSSVTLAAMLAPDSNDAARFVQKRAAEITGFVYRIIPGGRTETSNCGKSDPVHRDSHIELVLTPRDTAETRRVIVEVTPRWRAAAKQRGIDWSTATLQHTLEGHWVRVRGWLMFDTQHKGEAENTHPGGDRNWRATAWEIHPVATLTIVTGP